MAINLIKTKHDVIVFDVVDNCIQPVAAEGAKVGVVEFVWYKHYIILIVGYYEVDCNTVKLVNS